MSFLPNSTQVPNKILDELMSLLSDTELRVLLIIVRQTYGWIEDPLTGKRKEKDWIAYSQLEKKSGRLKQALTDAVRELENKDLIEVLGEDGQLLPPEQRRGKRLFYRIHTSLTPPMLNMGENHPSTWVKNTHTKETNTKRKEIYKENKLEQTKEYLSNIPPEDLSLFAQKYGTTITFVRESGESALNWLEANGKRKKNYRRFLMYWLGNNKFSGRMPKPAATGFIPYLEAKKKGLTW